MILILALYEDSKSCVAAAGGLSDAFSISVGVHQGSELRPLVFNLVIQEATKECHKGVPWDMLYADDQIITEESKEEVEQRFHLCKIALARRGLKINIDETKRLLYPRGNTLWSVCAECGKWVHKQCSGFRNVLHAQNYVCPVCKRSDGGEGVEQEHITLGPGLENVIEYVKTFTYLGDVVDRGVGVERVVRRRVATAWSK